MKTEFYGNAGWEALLPRCKEIWDKELVARPACYADSLGWLDCDEAAEGCVDELKRIAARWREIADTVVVVGVGGSNQAARGVIDALGSRGMDVVWAGNTLSAWEVERTLKRLEGRSVCLHVIAKNFETLEPGSHYRVLRKWMERRWNAREMAERVVLTGTAGSRLHEIAREKGHAFLPFPKPVGGRFTAFTGVGLLPIAAAGLDVDAYLQGGREAQRAVEESADNASFCYAAWRNAGLAGGFDTEMLVSFEPRFERLARWWRQLMGESEGKDGKGIFPAYSMYSEDLHSIGQYVQAGPRRLAETFVSVREDGGCVPVPADEACRDGFDYLNGRDFTFVNRAAEGATLAAHTEGGVPCARFTVDRVDERAFGQLYYMFMAACAVSGRLLGVNPFDQDGVEAYKRSMFKALGKDGQ